MTNNAHDTGETIAAVATAPGRGGVGIIRLSGPLALNIGKNITGISPKPRHAHFTNFHRQDSTLLDSGIMLYFPAPHSYTGEEVVEIQAHGGPVILDLLLATCCHWGARLARPGEFSERAFLNNRIDLAQAEAIADLIDSTSEQAALNASRSLHGEFSRQVHTLVSMVTRLRMYVEAAIDFPEEEIDFIGQGQVREQLADIIEQLDKVTAQARQGSLLREGMKLVIAGKPNAGKSSLLNALSGQETAIVTPIEGTTRDVLREHIQIDGLPLHIVDTAGLREGGDEVEIEGIRRAWREMDSADRILMVIDGAAASSEEDPELIWPDRKQHLNRDIPITIIHNKCDLSGKPASIKNASGTPVITLSATTGQGLDLLRQHLKTDMGYQENQQGLFSARRRHLISLQAAADFLKVGYQQLEDHGAAELLAEDLRQCQEKLGEITGTVTSDELLGNIFSNFCIGK